MISPWMDRATKPYSFRRYMAEILPIRRKTLSNQSLQLHFNKKNCSSWSGYKKLFKKDLKMSEYTYYYDFTIIYEIIQENLFFKTNKTITFKRPSTLHKLVFCHLCSLKNYWHYLVLLNAEQTNNLCCLMTPRVLYMWSLSILMDELLSTSTRQYSFRISIVHNR